MKIIITLFIVVVLLVSFLAYMGMFKKVTVKIEKKGPYDFAFVEHIGDYSKVSEPMNKLDSYLRQAGFNPTVGIGVYYDNPKMVEKSKLRSEVGSVIPTSELAKIEEKKNDFSFKKIAEAEYMVAEFPYRNKMSFLFAVIKVYPVLNKYISDNKYQSVPSIELYDMANKKINFLMEVKKINQ